MRKTVFSVILALSIASAGLVGCHADPDDPAGQAGELNDNVRRQAALANLHRLYTGALAKHGGNRNDPEVKKIADAIAEPLSRAYLDHREDTQNGLTMLDLMNEMRDIRTLPALLGALDWRPEVNEEHAVRGAQVIRNMQIPEGKKGEVVTALSRALEKINGSRGVDNKMRIEFLYALGSLGDRRATAVLTRVATSQSEEQDFRINLLAIEQLGKIADPASIDTLIKALFLFAPNNPAMRANDRAEMALVRIGRPAYEPLLQVLRGQHAEANQIAQQYIEAVRQRDARAASQMNVRALTTSEATIALGRLGFSDALTPIMNEVRGGDFDKRIAAAIAVAQLDVQADARTEVRDFLKQVYNDAPVLSKPQMLAIMRHTYDPELLPFFLEQARNADLHPEIRIEAVEAYAVLANKAEADALQRLIESEPLSEDGGYRQNFAESMPAIAAARECDENVQCWIDKINRTPNKVVARKAAYMLGRFGKGNDQAAAALVAKLDHSDLQVRLAALAALDKIAVNGNRDAIAKVDALQAQEEGRAIWRAFSQEALPIQARLRSRLASR